MKTTLFSLAFIAASGAYVGAANHLFDGQLPGPDVAAPPATAGELPAAATERELPPATPPAAATSLAAPQRPAPPPAPRIVAEAAPPPAMPAPPATPPLPRPRPAPAAIHPAASTATAASGGYQDGTYTGTDEDAYYGHVRVQVTISGHHIAAVKVLDYPQDRRTSRYINGQALPLLKQEALAATSARIDTVSGATLTSEAYIRSLGNALAQAGGGSHA